MPFTKQRGDLDYFIRDILQTKNFGKICSVAQCEVPGLKPTACLSPADPAANWVRSWPKTGSLASPEGSVNEACLSPADPAANWVRSWPRTGSLASPEGSVNEACLSPADPAAPL